MSIELQDMNPVSASLRSTESLEATAGALFLISGVLSVISPIMLISFGFFLIPLLFMAAYGMFKHERWAAKGGIAIGAVVTLINGLMLLVIVAFSGSEDSLLGEGFIGFMAVIMLINTVCCASATILSISIYTKKKTILVGTRMVYESSSPQRQIGSCPACGGTRLKFVDGVVYECVDCGCRY